VRENLESDKEALHATIILAVLYLLAIHSVFESGAKYHEPLIGFLAILAGQVATPSARVTESLKPDRPTEERLAFTPQS
jgi:hypothetical protein